MPSPNYAAIRPNRSSAHRSRGGVPFAKAWACLLTVALAIGLCPAVAQAEPDPANDLDAAPTANSVEDASASPTANSVEDASASPAATPQPDLGSNADAQTLSTSEPNDSYQYVKTTLNKEDLTQNLTELCNREIEGPQPETLLALPSAITIDMFAWSEYTNDDGAAGASLLDGSEVDAQSRAIGGMEPAPIVDVAVKQSTGKLIKKGLSTAGGIVGMISDFMAHHRIKQIKKDLDALTTQIDQIYRNTTIISEQIAELKTLIEEESYKDDLQKLQEVYSRWEPRFKQVSKYLELMYGAVYEMEGEADGIYVDQAKLEGAAETLMEYLRTLDINAMQDDMSQLSTLLSHATTQTGTSLVSSFNTVLDSRFIFQHESIPSIDTFVTASSNVYYALAKLYTERVGSDAYVANPMAYGIELDSLDEYYSRMISDFDAVVADTHLMDFLHTVGFEDAQWNYVDTGLDASSNPTDAVKGDHLDVSELVFISKDGDDHFNVMPDMLKQAFPITSFHDRFTGERLANAALENMQCFRVTARATSTTYYIAERPLYKNNQAMEDDYDKHNDSDVWMYRTHTGKNQFDTLSIKCYLKWDTSTDTQTLLTDADKLMADCTNANAGATTYSFATLIANALKDGHGQASLIQDADKIEYIPTTQEEVGNRSVTAYNPYVIPAKSYAAGSGLTYIDAYNACIDTWVNYYWPIAIDFPKTTTDIYTAADFKAAADTFNTPDVNQTYVLKSDITLDTNADYLARTLSNATFDGGGNTITYTKNNNQCNGDTQRVYYDQSSRQEGKPDGLFGSTDNATVKNLTVVGQLYQDNNNNFGTGGVVGYAKNSSIDNVISRVKVYNSAMFTGGVVGYAYYSSITNCTYEDMCTGFSNNHNWNGSVHGGSYFVGGIAGGFYGPSTEVEGHDFAKNRVVVLDERMRTDFEHTVYSDKWALGGLLGFIEGEAYTQDRMVIDNCAYAGTPLASVSYENSAIVGKVTDAHAVFKNTRSTKTGNPGVLIKWFDGGKHLNGTVSTEGFAQDESHDNFEYTVGTAFREATVEYRYPGGTVERDYRGRVWYGDVIPIRDAPEGMCVVDARWISDLEGGIEEIALPWTWPEHDALLTAKSKSAELMYPGADTSELLSLYYEYDRLPLSGTMVVTYRPLVRGTYTAQVGGVQLGDGALRTVGATLSRIIHALKTGIADLDDMRAFLSDETLAALREAAISGADVTFDVAVGRQTDQALIDEAEAFLAKQGLADAKVLAHYDITITVLVNGEAVGTLDKLDRPVSFAMKPGTTLDESRSYCAIAVHGNRASDPEIELLDAQRLDDETVQIAPERYSSFTLVSYDPAGGAANTGGQSKALASTGDRTASMACVIALLALGALGACALSLRRRTRRK